MAPSLLELTVDMSRHIQGKDMLESLIKETKSIKKLTVTNIRLMSSAEQHKPKKGTVNTNTYNNAIEFLTCLS
jgi:hypothetical protein